MKKFIALITTVGIFTGLKAQTGSIEGMVKTSDYQPAEFVNVILKGTHWGTSTDSKGNYRITNVKIGQYTIQISYVGLQTIEQQITVDNGEITRVPDIILQNDHKQLKEVVINAAPDAEYKVDIQSRSLRIDGPLIETPQNIQVVTNKIITDQQSLDMLEGVTRNVSGAQMIEHWGHFARINMRGTHLPAFRNGMNVEMPWGPLAEDMSMVDRIEFVKGPAGFMLSSGEPGGFYNVVTKQPTGISKGEVSLMLGSYNTVRSTLDLDGKLVKNGNLLYRLNLMGQLKGTQRDYEFNNRYTFFPSVKYIIDEKTTLNAEYTYQYSQMSAIGEAYVFSPNGYADLPRDFTTSEPNINPTDINEHSAFLTFSHELSPSWDLTAKVAYFSYSQTGSSLWPRSLDSVGNLVRGLGIWDAYNENKMGQTYLNGEITTGPIKHKILTGIDIGYKNYMADWNQSGALGGTIPFNIYDPQHGIPSDSIPQFDRSKSLRQRAGGNIVGQGYSAIYLQDELNFLEDRIRLTLAGRYTTVDQWQYGQNTEDEVFTPRVGLSISIDDNTSIYGLFDQSFLPQVGLDFEGNAFDPVKGKDIEAGIKKDWMDGKWNSTISIYEITKNNVLTSDPEHINFSIQLGQTVAKGIEFDLRGELLPGLQLMLNYANTDVEVTKDTNLENVGNKLAGHAKHITNGWLSYSFGDKILKGFGVSLGYQYQVERSSWSWSADNEASLPDYFRLDGALSFEDEQIRIALNINNLLDSYLYSGSPYANYYYWQTEPDRNYRLSFSYKF